MSSRSGAGRVLISLIYLVIWTFSASVTRPFICLLLIGATESKLFICTGGVGLNQSMKWKDSAHNVAYETEHS